MGDSIAAIGAAHDYNSSCEAGKKIEVGDYIVNVNGTTGQEMFACIQKDNNLSIKIKKNCELTLSIPKVGKLGLDLAFQDDKPYLLVKQVLEGSVQAYNAKVGMDQILRVPSRIIAVDGFKGKAADL